MTIETEATFRQRVADTANRENHSKDATKYWHEVLPQPWVGPYPEFWCGAFALWDLCVSLGCGLQWDIARHAREGSGFLHHLPQLPKGVEPELGDIAYKAKYQHHAVVVAAGTQADGKRYVVTMNGNAGPPPGEVLEAYEGQDDWTAFYSIGPLVRDALRAWQELNDASEPPPNAEPTT